MNQSHEVFSDVFAVYNFLTKEKGWSLGFHTPPQFEAMTLYGNRMAAAPMPMSPLWRGENEYHEKCLPSLYRHELIPLEKLERQIQLEDFREILQVFDGIWQFCRYLFWPQWGSKRRRAQEEYERCWRIFRCILAPVYSD